MFSQVLKKTSKGPPLSATIKCFLAIFLPLLLLHSAIMATLYYSERQNDRKLIESNEKHLLYTIKELLLLECNTVLADLALLSKLSVLTQYLDTDGVARLRVLQNEYRRFMVEKGSYAQIHLFDNAGADILQISLDDTSRALNSSQDYFEKIYLLQPGEVFVSPFQLASENSQFAQPLKPVIHFGTPIYDRSGKKRGILFLSFLGSKLLQYLDEAAGETDGQIMLLNSDGYWIKGRTADEEWGFLLEHRKDRRFASAFPEVWRQISDQKLGTLETTEGQFSFASIYPFSGPRKLSSATVRSYRTEQARWIDGKDYHWKIISHLSECLLFSASRQFLIRLMQVSAVLVGLIAAGSAYLARASVNRKSTSAELIQSEKKYRSLFENSLDAIFISTPDGKIIEMNPAGVKLLAYSSKEEIQNLSIPETLYLHPERREAFEEALQHHGFVENLEVVLKTRDGRTVTVLESATAFRDETGKIVAYRGIMHDITERQQLQEQLLQAQKMETLGTLVGGVAHDFNNLLTVILGNTEFGKEDSKPDDPVHKDVLNIEQAASEARDLVRQLLSFSRRQILELKTLDLNETIQDLLHMLRRIIKENIGLETKFDKKLVQVSADATQVKQVLMNLFVNARDAMPNGGSLLLETRNYVPEADFPIDDENQASEYAQITLKDTGACMNEETKAHIFDPFFTTKEAGKGTGLGLSVVYGIIKQHHGHIEVRSAPGEGTTVNLYFPEVREIETVQKEATLRQPAPKGTETILVVEDDEAVRQVTVRSLQNLGYKVLSANDGIKGAKIFKSQPPEAIDLVVIDMVMPKRNGLDVYRDFQSLKRDQPVIFMTGYSDKAQLQALAGLESQHISILHKPFTGSILGKMVRELLDRKGEA